MKKKLLIILVAVLIPLMIYSRLYLGISVHYNYQTLATATSVLIGFTISSVVLVVSETKYSGDNESKLDEKQIENSRKSVLGGLLLLLSVIISSSLEGSLDGVINGVLSTSNSILSSMIDLIPPHVELLPTLLVDIVLICYMVLFYIYIIDLFDTIDTWFNNYEDINMSEGDTEVVDNSDSPDDEEE